MDFGAMAAAALRLALVLSLPALVASLAVSLALASFELARGHETTLGFVPKLLGVGLALWLSREFMSSQLSGYAAELFRGMAQIAR
jgi:flagellar biosynthesis protein FliQ